ncbi:MAG TPA: hypothetical protein VFO67_15275 [Gemmatimonadales bacterium]|nr:hypothetical protein [Gemmatimonadales bacterium]
MRRSAFVFCLLAPVAELLSGQRCLGGNPYGTSHIRVGGGISKDIDAETYNVDFRYSTAGVFGMVTAAQKTWGPETFDDESLQVGATVGIAYPRDGSSRWSVCPMLSYGNTSGPDQAVGAYYYSEKAFSGAVSLGYMVSRSASWDIVPTATLTVGTTNPTLTDPLGRSRGSYGDFCCGPRGFGNVSLGLGMVLIGSITVLPSISFPLDVVGETLYSLHLVIGGGT